ncbi:unnamed protein product [Rotaria sp. Silwood1]|nr:unnamed protein product [Rotaria sp. Silwood1]CAF1646655.1 unnamed protein product [Rotaria sp. Silwood1]
MEYLQDPIKNCLKKDTCIFLVLALASKSETQKFGITKTSSFISIPAFYAINSLPLIKADCLKFLLDVRNQIDRHVLLISVPECVRYLSSNNIVVQTYAAHAIERLLLNSSKLVLIVSKNPGLLDQFAQILFPVFTPIFTEDIAEFVPYVLQIIGFILESRSSGSISIADAYRALFQLILTLSFWDRSGNIPALSRLLQTYIEKAGETIVLEKLTTILGVFQHLVSQSKVHDHEGFAILNSLIINLPATYLNNYLKDIFIVIFTRLTKAKIQKLI